MSCDLISNLGMSQSVRLVRVTRRVRKRAVMEEGAEERRFGSFVACRWEEISQLGNWYWEVGGGIE